MERLLRHRGPDGSGLYRDGYSALAQTRLAIIGPPACPLPVSSPDGRYTIVYNGEVYNFEALARELRLDNARNDTAVVLAAWIRWGARSLARFNGMFAFFIWDAIEQRGFGACDPLGIKPFLYAHDAGRFAFASEAGALIESGAAPFSPDAEAIAESLVAPYFSSAVRLPFAGIKRLPPGHWIEVTRDGAAITEYFRFEHARAPVADVAAFVDQTAERVEFAVSQSLRADLPIGVFLSGGVDSSLMAAIAQRHCDHPLPAWTISYGGNSHADYARSLIVTSDDLPFAALVAERHGLAHSIVHVEDALFRRPLLCTLRANDLIAAWEQEVSQQLLAQTASAQVKAVLVGDAADETHFGYSFLLNPERIASPRRIIEFFGVPPLRRSLVDDAAACFTRKYQRFAEDLGYSWKNASEQRLAMSCLIHRLWLTRLLHNGDIHLMAHSVEGRVPYGDAALLTLAQRVPQELGYAEGIEKWHLRRAAERFLEPAIAWRPKSALTKSLRAHQAVHDAFSSAWRRFGALIEPYVDCDAVHRMASSGAPRTEVETGLCFRLLAVMTWFERFSRFR